MEARKNEKGFTLIEGLVAMGVIGIGISIGVATLTNTSKTDMKTESNVAASPIVQALLIDAAAQVKADTPCGAGMVIPTGNGQARQHKGKAYIEEVICVEKAPGNFFLTAKVTDPTTGSATTSSMVHTPHGSAEHEVEVSSDDSGWENESDDDDHEHSDDDHKDEDHDDPHNDHDDSDSHS